MFVADTNSATRTALRVLDKRAEQRPEQRPHNERIQQQPGESGPLKKSPNSSANSAPIRGPSPAPISAARPAVMRPVTCSTKRRPRPTIASRSTANP
jgi:hypothetical protein